MSARRDLLAIDVARAGLVIWCRPMRPRDAWLHEGLTATARRGMAVKVLRDSVKRRQAA